MLREDAYEVSGNDYLASTSNINFLAISLPDALDASSSSIAVARYGSLLLIASKTSCSGFG